RVWRVETGLCEAVLVGHTGRGSQVAFSPDGELLVSVSVDGTARLWRVATGRTVTRDPIRLSPQILSAAWHPDGQFWAAGDEGGTVHFFDRYAAEFEGRQIPHLHGPLTSLTFTPDGRGLMLTRGGDEGHAYTSLLEVGAQRQTAWFRQDGFVGRGALS